MNTIGKLLWHKAERSHATFNPTNPCPEGKGEVIITVPAIFQFSRGVTRDYEDIKRRIILAACNRLLGDRPKLRKKGETFATAEATIHWATPQRGEAIITIKTPHLDVWQHICNQKFATVTTTKTTYLGDS